MVCRLTRIVCRTARDQGGLARSPATLKVAHFSGHDPTCEEVNAGLPDELLGNVTAHPLQRWRADATCPA